MMWLVLAIAWICVGATLAWTWGRFNWYGDDGRGYRRNPTAEEIFWIGALSMLWPITGPIYTCVLSAKRGAIRREEVAQAEAELAKEIREAMPEVEKLLGEALTPEIGVWMKEVKQLAGKR